MDINMFTENNTFLMLALDHRESFKKFINPENPDSVTNEVATESKKKIIDKLKDKFTGVLIDINYGLPAYKELGTNKPFLLPMEKSGYTLVDNERQNTLVLKAEELKNMGASGTKVLIYFNPDLKSAKSQVEIARTAVEDSKASGMPMFLEIVTYDMFDEEKVYRSVEYFMNHGVIPDVFKIEFPGSEYMCQKISKLLGSIPWILLTRGADYALFREQLTMSVNNGCRGFLAGRSIWQEYFEAKDEMEKEKFLNETLTSRFDEISKITLGI
jgi:tagatose 1,6-diphosphate aldolase